MSILKRSAVSFVGNSIRALLAYFTGLLIARGLGPAEFGVYSFLLISFTSLRPLLEMGSQNAFFSFISKKERSKSFVNYYFLWVLVQFIIVLFFIVFVAPDEWVKSIWIGENRERVVLAFVAVFFQQQVWSIIGLVGESQRLTINVQAVNVVSYAVHFCVIFLLYNLDSVGIDIVYYVIIIEFAVFSILSKYFIPAVFGDQKEKIGDVLREYFVFCVPLLPLIWFGAVRKFLDPWMLQSFGGAVEQSYFVVATQFSAVSLIATSSVLRIIWKEVSEANHNNDHVKIITLYQKSTHMLFFVGVIISGFLIPWVVEIIAVTLDSRYLGGALVMAVMLVYPIHQSLGQLNGTILNALELSKEKMILETGQIILSIIVSYIVLAPSDAAIPGLGLASYGLAVKMVCMQIVYVNFVIWWLSRRLGFEFNIYYQVKGLVVFPLLGVGAYNIGNLSDELVLSFIVAAVVYMMMFFVIVYFYPNVVGLDKKDFHGLVAKLRKW